MIFVRHTFESVVLDDRRPVGKKIGDPRDAEGEGEGDVAKAGSGRPVGGG